MKKYFLLFPIVALILSCNRGEQVKYEKDSKDTLTPPVLNEQYSNSSFFSEITCPKCKHTKSEKLPTEVCLVSYTCENCKEVLHPKDGDCCVFCTYGTHKCPSKQDE
ncbi:MAG: GDCCVxC domain-containing (seleno)protein [Bacteroidota bacterium]